MGKIKCKKIFWFIFCFLFFIILDISKVSASGEYEVSVNKIENLFYGNYLKDSYIKGVNSIEGVFSFHNHNEYLDDVGNRDFLIDFTPSNTEYAPRTIIYHGVIERRRLYPVFEEQIFKKEDGTKIIDLPKYNIYGIIDEEVNIDGELIGEAEFSYPMENIPLSLSGIEISGDKKDCYYLDLTNYVATIYPSSLKKEGEDATIITLDEETYVAVASTLKIVKDNNNEVIDTHYTSFLKYSYEVYNHYNKLIQVDGNYKINMLISESIMNTERLQLFELTKNGEYKKLDYKYSNGHIYFTMASDSSFVLATRNIEYNMIIIYSTVLLFSLVFVIVYRFKNSKIKEYKEY